MMRRGFTLIELLVVIAIIAILAAILFPVFAQARLAAQGAASISNARQISTGMLLYSGDYSDVFPLATAWNTGNDPIVSNGNGVSTWVTLVMPYIRTGELFDDPLGPGSANIQDLPTTVSVSIQSTYGYNYRAMSPVFVEGGIARQQPRGQTSAANPSNTVLVVSKFASSEWNQGVDQVAIIPGVGGDGFDFGPALNVTVEPPLSLREDLFPGVGFSNWGLGSPMETNFGLTDRNGGNTGGVAFRRTDNAIVAFLDGSVRTQNRGQMAAGTNWNPEINTGAIDLVDPTQYIWDLD